VGRRRRGGRGLKRGYKGVGGKGWDGGNRGVCE